MGRCPEQEGNHSRYAQPSRTSQGGNRSGGTGRSQPPERWLSRMAGSPWQPVTAGGDGRGKGCPSHGPSALRLAILIPSLKAAAAGGERGGCSGPGRQLGPFLACLMRTRPSRNRAAWIPALGEGAQAPEAEGHPEQGVLVLLSTRPLPMPRLYRARGLLPGSFFFFNIYILLNLLLQFSHFFLPFILLCHAPPPSPAMVLRVWRTQGLGTVGGTPPYPEPLPQAAAASAFSQVCPVHQERAE